MISAEAARCDDSKENGFCIDVEDEDLGEGQAQKDATFLDQAFDNNAPSILKFVNVRDIVAFHLGSKAFHACCRSCESGKLLVPTFFLRQQCMAKVELTTVEVLYADDAKLVTYKQNEEFSELLVACTGLKELYCSHNLRAMTKTLAHGLSCLSKLIVLDLAHNGLAVETRGSFKYQQSLDNVFSAFSPQLRILDLSYNSLKDDHAVRLAEALESRCVGNGCGLEQLRVRSNYLGNLAGIAFGRFMSSPAGVKLWQLDMRTNKVQEEGACAMLSALKEHPCMREMRVGYNQKNVKQDLETAHLVCILLQRALSATHRNHLTMLDLNDVRIGDEGMKRMSRALALNTVLTRLDIAFNSIGNEGAKALAFALEHNRHLEHLDIRDNEIGDEGAQALAAGLSNNQSLRIMKLARNSITPCGGLSLMAALRGNSSLHIDFGASGGKLQGVMRRTPRMADYRFMRDLERQMSLADDAERRQPHPEESEQLTSLMFSQN